MNLKARKRLAMLVQVVGLPVYIVAARSHVGPLPPPNWCVALAIYCGLGLAGARPLLRPPGVVVAGDHKRPGEGQAWGDRVP